MGTVTRIRSSKRPPAKAALPNLEHPVTAVRLGSISGTADSIASSVLWTPHAHAVNAPCLHQPMFQKGISFLTDVATVVDRPKRSRLARPVRCNSEVINRRDSDVRTGVDAVAYTSYSKHNGHLVRRACAIWQGKRRCELPRLPSGRHADGESVAASCGADRLLRMIRVKAELILLKHSFDLWLATRIPFVRIGCSLGLGEVGEGIGER